MKLRPLFLKKERGKAMAGSTCSNITSICLMLSNIRS